MCTRALWCLTNQQLPVDHMTSHVTTIVDVATEVITVHQVGMATVSSEALNLLMRYDLPNYYLLCGMTYLFDWVYKQV